MTDETWTVDTGRTDGGIVANGNIASGSIPATPDRTRGKEVQFTLGFWEDPAIATDHVTRYKALRDYQEYAGSVSVNQAITGQPLVTERVPDAAPVDSLIVDFIPGGDVDHTTGFWGVIQSMTDQTRVPADMGRIEVRATVLANATDYADRAELQNAIGGDLP